MAEYIDKEKAVRELALDYAYAAAEMVQNMQAADVAPVVHSKWIFNDEWWEFRCTNCQGPIGNVKKYNYCPHCGAKMDGGEKDAQVPT